ncbi:tumor susceptibility gene 101 protein [Diprion similis]|uniref:tumor susceptibility gene 101 protein n=1 Tax=Diprion similis TaxID=362088 RepID=UPI001EF86ADB|nr:tumor susceptibility gene 101 protein [Diprion similis]
MVKMTQINEGKIRQCLTKYQHPDLTYRDVVSVLSQYFALQYRVEPYVFTDGTRKELFSLQGTIPVTYKGNVYNIPICVWLMDTHPNNAPICYVKPTADMNIKVSMYVDHNGKIYLPYLHEWVPQKSDLLSLIQVMRITFGEQPPVYAKPKNDNQTSSTPYPVQSFMPVPGSGGTSTSGFPPYPSASQYGTGSNVYPPYPTSGTPGMPYPGYTPYPGSTSSYGGPVFPGSYPTPYPPVTQPSPRVPGNSSNTDTISEEHIRESLLSAVGDKLRRRLREQLSQGEAELETLRRTEQELASGSARLEELLNKLNREKSELEKNINILEEKESELEREISKLSDNQTIDVDEAVTTIAPLYKQMLNAFAEEAAIEDAIYYLGEGLRGGIIDLEAFLKQVRQLSRRQFMLRALMLRCRQKAGLAG